MLYSKVAGMVRWSDGNIRLSEGQSIDEDHPLVKERPDLWTDEAPSASITSRVQSTMQRPGETRVERPGVPRIVKRG